MPIAICMLAASDQLETDQLEQFIIVGELALTGAVRPVKGVLPIALRARAEHKVGLLVPADNAAEAAVVEGLQVIPIHNLREAASFLEGELKLSPTRVDIREIFDKPFAPARFRSRITACFFSMNCPSSSAAFWRPCANPWKRGTSPSLARQAR